MLTNDDRTPPTRIHVSTGLQEGQLADLVKLDALCAAMYHEVGFDAAEVPARDQGDFVALARHNSVRVAEADGVVAGFLAWHDESPGVGYLVDLQVHPEYQRFGIDKSEREPREKTAEKLGPHAEEVFSILDDATKGKSERLDTVEAGLRHRGLQDYVKRDYTVVRGLAYYTGVVFEVFDRSGEFRAIAGGGRYDTLLKNLGGVDLPALGFGIGDVVLGEILKGKKWQGWDVPELKAYLVVADEAFRPQAMALLQELRHFYAIDYPFLPTKVGKQFQIAEERGCDVAIVIDQQINERKLDVKVLATREQIKVSLDEAGLIIFLQNLEFKKQDLAEPTQPVEGQPPA